MRKTSDRLPSPSKKIAGDLPSVRHYGCTQLNVAQVSDVARMENGRLLTCFGVAKQSTMEYFNNSLWIWQNFKRKTTTLHSIFSFKNAIAPRTHELFIWNIKTMNSFVLHHDTNWMAKGIAIQSKMDFSNFTLEPIKLCSGRKIKCTSKHLSFYWYWGE